MASIPSGTYRATRPKSTGAIHFADKISKKCLEIINFFNPPLWYVETPLDSRLKNRDFMQGLHFGDTSFDQFEGDGYTRPTRIWGPPCVEFILKDFPPSSIHKETYDSSRRIPPMVRILIDNSFTVRFAKPEHLSSSLQYPNLSFPSHSYVMPMKGHPNWSKKPKKEVTNP